MLEADSKIVKVGKQGGARLYIPSNIVNDSQFPFKPGEKVLIEIRPHEKTVVISGHTKK